MSFAPAAVAFLTRSSTLSTARYAIHCSGTPSGYSRIALPVHVIGLVAMGLWLVDNCDLEALATTCETLSRWEFLLSVSPLRLTGLTGSAVNPIATF